MRGIVGLLLLITAGISVVHGAKQRQSTNVTLTTTVAAKPTLPTTTLPPTTPEEEMTTTLKPTTSTTPKATTTTTTTDKPDDDEDDEKPGKVLFHRPIKKIKSTSTTRLTKENLFHRPTTPKPIILKAERSTSHPLHQRGTTKKSRNSGHKHHHDDDSEERTTTKKPIQPTVKVEKVEEKVTVLNMTDTIGEHHERSRRQTFIGGGYGPFGTQQLRQQRVPIPYRSVTQYGPQVRQFSGMMQPGFGLGSPIMQQTSFQTPIMGSGFGGGFGGGGFVQQQGPIVVDTVTVEDIVVPDGK